MKSVVAYVRSLLGWCDEPQPIRTSFKRDRVDDDLSSDDENETPALKRLKQLKKTNFPDIMATNDAWDKEENHSKNVRYIPIQVESHPTTSTPNVSSTKSRERIVPIKLMGMSQNGPSTPARKPRMHTPVRPVIHAVLDDESDDQEVTWVESKPPTASKKLTKVYIDLDDDDDDNNPNQPEGDIIYMKKVTTPPPTRPYKYFIAKNSHDVTDATEAEPVFLKLSRKSNDRSMLNLSPRTYTKFKAPPGITKSYKKAPTPLPKWMQPPKPTTSSISSYSRNRFSGLNGSARSTLSEVFNLDEKKNYQELIRRVTDSMKPLSFGRRADHINSAEDAAQVKLTQRTQKNALNEINLLEKGLNAEKNNLSKEYDPITVASINSSDSEVEIVASESSTTSSLKIDPINTLRDSYRDVAVTSGDWLSKLNSKYKKKRQEMKEKVQEARRESDIISKVNNAQKIAQLEHKLKYELRIPESLVVDTEPTEEPEFPELTPEQLQLIKKAMGPGSPNQLLVEKFNLQIHRRDLLTLAGLNWLNDEVINFYMNLLMQRSQQRNDLPKVYATNTFFYPRLMQSGQPGLRRWTKKMDIFTYDLMVIPVHMNVHWCVSMINFKTRRIQYLDSMGGRNQGCLDALLQYLRDEHRDKKGRPFDETDWKCETPEDIPHQMNGSDCGMFACTFAEFACRGARYTFSQTHMPYLRRKAALEILTGKLLM